jgi:hypothetical protein
MLAHSSFSESGGLLLKVFPLSELGFSAGSTMMAFLFSLKRPYTGSFMVIYMMLFYCEFRHFAIWCPFHWWPKSQFTDFDSPIHWSRIPIHWSRIPIHWSDKYVQRLQERRFLLHECISYMTRETPIDHDKHIQDLSSSGRMRRERLRPFSSSPMKIFLPKNTQKHVGYRFG